jgi:hypothetical protein
MNARFGLRLMIPGFLLGVVFAGLALGLVAPGVFDAADRLYFGFASGLGFIAGILGLFMLLWRRE